MKPKILSIEGGALAVPDPDAGGVRVYKGIPYAAPPLGPLRWRPPEPVPAWTDVRPTDTFGPNSLQGVVWDDIDPFAAGVSEDCLYLNVWTPAAPGEGAGLSTMVWIHGGGFVAGSGAEPRYDGAHLAARGIIVDTLIDSMRWAFSPIPSSPLNRVTALQATMGFSILLRRLDG